MANKSALAKSADKDAQPRNDLSPARICEHLDDYVIGQGRAKRALAIALRNRWRRLMLPQEVADEITPKNILMIGPTGVGKTELARRLAALVGAPFLKVDATRFTEVGYVGRDVESIVRDLVERSFEMEKARQLHEVEEQTATRVEERLLDMLVQGRAAAANVDADAALEQLRQQLRNGELEEREVESEFKARSPSVGVVGPPGMEEISNQLQNMISGMGLGGKEKHRTTVAKARQRLQEEEGEALLDSDQVEAAAIGNAEKSGVVFIDEIDKVCGDERGGEVSRRGVQRDLLPLIEGCQVNTRMGLVRTDHMLFIAAGAFHLSRPSDLIPELQGRLPIRVQLESLTVDDLARILTQPKHSLFQQYQALLSVEGLDLRIPPECASRIAEVAVQINASTEDIGARRLHTLMEHLLEEMLFEGGKGKVDVDLAMVEAKLGALAADTEQSRYVL